MTRIHRTGAWLAVTALLLASSLALAQGSQEKTQPTQGEKHAVVKVKGMSCPFCAFGLNKHLQRLAGGKNVDVSLEKGEAYINANPNTSLPHASTPTPPPYA